MFATVKLFAMGASKVIRAAGVKPKRNATKRELQYRTRLSSPLMRANARPQCQWDR